jgi:hypothetical protein
MDEIFEIPKDKISSWRIKRNSTKRKLVKRLPDITKNELEWAFQQYGLDAESDPRNKHYVRCMHD